ncbi:F-box/kelch-repeat protein At3g23880 [Medicago truncatula]|uniref:F-box protein interaction domain protein n=1 Tax=Medicago truncatula TaxID=3880 RepID=A0A072VIQ8_MEDTR|nr:F-box/kelch-repeat protein At3g23880-like [Medicago truncatula]KEH41874.1 F-box protein interaction domain protein [Medicago truncatula]
MEETTATTRQPRPTTSTATLTLPVKRQQPPVTELPFDLMVEILCRLPVKSLLRFRSVCKSWNSLISNNPKFTYKHLHISTTKPKLVIFTHTETRPRKIIDVTSIELDFIFTSTPTQIEFSFINQLIASCDGLICFQVNKSRALLWNPSTTKSKLLPLLDIPLQANDGRTIFTFGYDPFIHNYKVFSVFCYDFKYDGFHTINGCKTEVKVHTLGTHSWRRIQDFPSMVHDDEPGTIVNGKVYWFAYSYVSGCYTRHIVSLDLGKESYKEISLPDMMLVPLTMGCLRDSLSLVFHSNTFNDVWLFKECGNEDSWIKLIRLPRFGRDEDRFFSYSNVIYISEDNNHVLLNFKDDDKLKWAVYDSKNDTSRNIKTQDWSLVDSKVYVESLVSL